VLQLFAATILYGQILVGLPSASHVGLLWGEAEVAQGFAWDPEVVAFGVPDHDGPCLVSVDTSRETPFTPDEDALWAVAVPFAATEPVVSVGTVLEQRPFPIRPGAYQLVFQARPGGPEHAYRLEVIFVRGGPPDFAVLKRGELDSATVLSTRARRA
jgi:hypothetical protein